MKKLSRIRIIAGKWRSRLISFANDDIVRPTPDRIRETVFNWLSPYIDGARCLDTFAGSGALGFEALSRGASHVIMVEQNPATLKHIQENQTKLETSDVTLCLGKIPRDFPRVAKQIPAKFLPLDIIFMDPPFKQGLLAPCCQWLEENNWVKSGTIIYIEAESELDPLPIPANWELIKEKSTQQIRYGLAKRI